MGIEKKHRENEDRTKKNVIEQKFSGGLPKGGGGTNNNTKKLRKGTWMRSSWVDNQSEEGGRIPSGKEAADGTGENQAGNSLCWEKKKREDHLLGK